MQKEKKLTLIFIVNGVDVPIEVLTNQPLHAARNKALEESNNTGRPMDEWEVHNDEGVALDASGKIEDLGLVDGARLFLNLKVGAGGCK